MMQSRCYIHSIISLVLFGSGLGCAQFGEEEAPQQIGQPALSFDKANRLAMDHLNEAGLDPLVHDIYIIVPDANRYQVTVTIKGKPFQEVLNFYIAANGTITAQ